MKIIGVTKCPTGIAHTYIAAERLEKYGKELGCEIRVETQGAQVTENALTAEEIAAADYVILAADAPVEGRERFDGKRVYETPIRPVLADAAGILKRLPELAGIQGESKTADESAMSLRAAVEHQKSIGGRTSAVRQLMNGTSYMIPFVVVGGLLTSFSLAFDSESSVSGLVITSAFWGRIKAIGDLAFGLMYPIFAGFLANAIAGRAALAPVMIGAMLVTDGEILGTGAGTGILGCILVGYLAGWLVKWMNVWKLPKALRSMMPIFIIPFCGASVIALLFIGLLGQPIAFLMAWLDPLLALLAASPSTAIPLGLLLGAMIGVDMGGPINKCAFLFGMTSIAEGNPEIMGIAAAAIPVAPLSLGLAVLLRRDKFTAEEQGACIYTILMGLLGISEGAIPYATTDLKRVILSVTAGSAAAGAAAAFFHVSVVVPHGGPVVGALGASSNILLYSVSILVGTVVAALLVLALKPTLSEADEIL